MSVRGRAVTWWSGFACGLGAAGLLALWAGRGVPAAEAGHASFDREVFHEALDAVLDRYVEPVDGSTLLAHGLKHIVAELDGYSHFLTAAERKALRELSAKDGTAGLSVQLHVAPGGGDRTLEVMGVLPGSAADRAGLVPGDHILEIDGIEVARLLSQVEAEVKLGGEVGQTLALRVQRGYGARPERLDLVLGEVPRELLSSELVEVTTRDGHATKAAIVTLRGFRKGTGEAFKRRLAQLRRAAGPAGLGAVVLDLRGNPGGEVDEALVVADLFVSDGILTRTRGRGGRILREEHAHDADTDTDTPLVVLQDRHTASAAELLTAALRDNGRAKSVGERSYGKGTVQEIMGMPDGSVLKLTIARYFSPKDTAIDGVGVAPDVELSLLQRSQAVDEGLAVLGLHRTAQ